MVTTQSKIIDETVAALADFAVDDRDWVSGETFGRYAAVVRGMRVGPFGTRGVMVTAPATPDGVLWQHTAAEALDRAAGRVAETSDGNGHIMTYGLRTVFTWP